MREGLKIATVAVLLLIISFGLFLYFKAYLSPSYIHYRVGERLYKEGKYRAAFEEFKTAFQLDPYNRAARLRLAELKEILKINERKSNK